MRDGITYDPKNKARPYRATVAGYLRTFSSRAGAAYALDQWTKHGIEHAPRKHFHTQNQ